MQNLNKHFQATLDPSVCYQYSYTKGKTQLCTSCWGNYYAINSIPAQKVSKYQLTSHSPRPQQYQLLVLSKERE